MPIYEVPYGGQTHRFNIAGSVPTADEQRQMQGVLSKITDQPAPEPAYFPMSIPGDILGGFAGTAAEIPGGLAALARSISPLSSGELEESDFYKFFDENVVTGGLRDIAEWAASGSRNPAAQLAQGIGSMLTFIGPGAAGRGATAAGRFGPGAQRYMALKDMGMKGKAAARAMELSPLERLAYAAAPNSGVLAAGMGLGAGEQAQRIIEERAGGAEISPLQERLAVLMGGAIGATEIAPIERILKGIPSTADKYAKETVINALTRAFANGIAEGSQEALAGLAQNLTEKAVYNPNQDPAESLWSEFGVGAGAGFFADLLFGAVGRRAGRRAMEQEERVLRDTREERHRGKITARDAPAASPVSEALAGQPTPVAERKVDMTVIDGEAYTFVPFLQKDPEETGADFADRQIEMMGPEIPEGPYKGVMTSRGIEVQGAQGHKVGPPAIGWEEADARVRQLDDAWNKASQPKAEQVQPSGLLIPGQDEIAPADIHALADERKVLWDGDPAFMDLTKKITGKSHLDNLSQPELTAIYKAVQDMPANQIETSIDEMPIGTVEAVDEAGYDKAARRLATDQEYSFDGIRESAGYPNNPQGNARTSRLRQAMVRRGILAQEGDKYKLGDISRAKPGPKRELPIGVTRKHMVRPGMTRVPVPSDTDEVAAFEADDNAGYTIENDGSLVSRKIWRSKERADKEAESYRDMLREAKRPSDAVATTPVRRENIIHEDLINESGDVIRRTPREVYAWDEQDQAKSRVDALNAPEKVPAVSALAPTDGREGFLGALAPEADAPVPPEAPEGDELMAVRQYMNVPVGGDNGPGHTRLSDSEDLGLHSRLYRAAMDMPQKKGSGEQMLRILEKATKPEEIRWSGVDDFLRGRRSVTDAEIVEYLEENEMSLEEFRQADEDLGSGNAADTAYVEGEAQRRDEEPDPAIIMGEGIIGEWRLAAYDSELEDVLADGWIYERLPNNGEYDALIKGMAEHADRYTKRLNNFASDTILLEQLAEQQWYSTVRGAISVEMAKERGLNQWDISAEEISIEMTERGYNPDVISRSLGAVSRSVIQATERVPYEEDIFNEDWSPGVNRDGSDHMLDITQASVTRAVKAHDRPLRNGPGVIMGDIVSRQRAALLASIKALKVVQLSAPMLSRRYEQAIAKKGAPGEGASTFDVFSEEIVPFFHRVSLDEIDEINPDRDIEPRGGFIDMNDPDQLTLAGFELPLLPKESQLKQGYTSRLSDTPMDSSIVERLVTNSMLNFNTDKNSEKGSQFTIGSDRGDLGAAIYSDRWDAEGDLNGHLQEYVDARRSEVAEGANVLYEAGDDGESQWGAHLIPGKISGYSEFLLTIPQSSLDKRMLRDMTSGRHPVEMVQSEDGWTLVLPEGASSREDGFPAGSEMRDRRWNIPFTGGAAIERALKEAKRHGNFNYTGGHWSEPNTIAHARLTDRKFGDMSVLAADEIQSDIHQTVRKKKTGYSDSLAERGPPPVNVPNGLGVVVRAKDISYEVILSGRDGRKPIVVAIEGHTGVSKFAQNLRGIGIDPDELSSAPEQTSEIDLKAIAGGGVDGLRAAHEFTIDLERQNQEYQKELYAQLTALHAKRERLNEEGDVEAALRVTVQAENIQGHVNILSDATDDLSAYRNSILKRMDVITTNKMAPPPLPFRKNWDEIMVKRLVHHAALNGYQYVATPTAAAEREMWNQAWETFYDSRLPKLMGAIAKKHGTTVEVEKLDGNDWYLMKISPEMSRSIVDEGFPMWSTRANQISQNSRRAEQTGQVQETARDRLRKAIPALATEKARLVPGEVEMKVVNEIVDDRFDKEESPSGRYTYKMISIAVDWVNEPHINEASRKASLMWTLRHEGIHALRSLDLFTSSEWSRLVADAASIVRPGYDGRTYLEDAKGNYEGMRGYTQSTVHEEAIANMFADRYLRPTPLSPETNGLIERVVRFFENLGKALKGQGFRSNEDIFQTIDRGELAKRRQGKIRTPLLLQKAAERSDLEMQTEGAAANKAVYQAWQESGTDEPVLAMKGTYELSSGYVGSRVAMSHAETMLKQHPLDPAATALINDIRAHYTGFMQRLQPHMRGIMAEVTQAPGRFVARFNQRALGSYDGDVNPNWIVPFKNMNTDGWSDIPADQRRVIHAIWGELNNQEANAAHEIERVDDWGTWRAGRVDPETGEPWLRSVTVRLPGVQLTDRVNAEFESQLAAFDKEVGFSVTAEPQGRHGTEIVINVFDGMEITDDAVIEVAVRKIWPDQSFVTRPVFYRSDYIEREDYREIIDGYRIPGRGKKAGAPLAENDTFGQHHAKAANVIKAHGREAERLLGRVRRWAKGTAEGVPSFLSRRRDDGSIKTSIYPEGYSDMGNITPGQNMSQLAANLPEDILYVAMNPHTGRTPDERMYSLKGNRPKLDAATQRTLDRISPVNEYRGWGQVLLDTLKEREWDEHFTRFRQAFINKYDRVEKVSREAAGLLGDKILMAENSALAALLFSDRSRGIASAAFQWGGVVYRDGITKVIDTNEAGQKVKGLADALAPLFADGQNLLQVWHAYRVGMREDRFNAEGRKVLTTDAERATARDLLKQFPVLAQVDKDWNNWNDMLVVFLKDTGILNDAQADAWMKHSDYIPFYRQVDGEDTVGPRMFHSAFGVKPTPKAKGSKEKIPGSPMETIAQNALSAINAGMRNIAGQRVIRDTSAVGLARRIYSFEQASEHNASAPADKQVEGEKVTDDAFSVRENGEDTYYEIADQLLVDSVMGALDGHIPWLGILSGPANVLRELVTRDPGFILANLMRDTTSAWITSGSNYTPFWDTFKHFAQDGAAIVQGDMPEDLKKMSSAGVIGGYDFVMDPKNIGKHIQDLSRERAGAKKGITGSIKWVWDRLGQATTVSDAATRQAVYNDVLDKTGSEAEALFQALEVINFSRRGNSQTIRILSAAIPFFNARIQGLDLIYRSFSGSYSAHQTFRDPASIAKTALMRSMGMMFMSLMYYYAVSDDDEWRNATLEARDDHWIIPTGKDSPAIKIPVPFELGFFFKTMPERLAALAEGDDTTRDVMRSWWRGLGTTLNFNPLQIQAVAPAYEAWHNKSNFTGRPIVPAYMGDLDPEYQKRESTSEPAVWITKILNSAASPGEGISPMQVDHILGGYFGTLGSYAVGIVDTVLREATGAPSRPDRELHRYPVLKRFLQDDVGGGFEQQFYDIRSQVRSAVQTTNHLRRAGKMDEFEEYYKERGYLLAFNDTFRRMDKTMRKFRDQMLTVERSSMDPAEKKVVLRQLREARMEYLRGMPFYNTLIFERSSEVWDQSFGD